MSSYPCEDCEKPWQSIKAAIQCPCDREDEHGYPVEERGTGWLD